LIGIEYILVNGYAFGPACVVSPDCSNSTLELGKFNLVVAHRKGI